MIECREPNTGTCVMWRIYDLENDREPLCYCLTVEQARFVAEFLSSKIDCIIFKPGFCPKPGAFEDMANFYDLYADETE